MQPTALEHQMLTAHILGRPEARSGMVSFRTGQAAAWVRRVETWRKVIFVI